MYPRNQQPLPPPLSVNPFMIMQQLLELHTNTIPWCEGFYAGSLYQQNQHLYRTPSSGPHRNQRTKGSRKAEAQYFNKFLHESPGTITGDRSTGINPGYAQIGANGNARAGKV